MIARFGGLVPGAARLPGDAADHHRLRFTAAGLRRGGKGVWQDQLLKRRSRRHSLVPHFPTQFVKGRYDDPFRGLGRNGFRPGFLRRGKVVPPGGAAALDRLAALGAGIATGRALRGFCVPAAGGMAQVTLSVGFAAIHLVLPALMGAVQLIAALGVGMARLAVGRGLRWGPGQAADQFVRVTARRVLMLAGMGRPGLAVPAFGGVRRVVFAQAGFRLRRKSR